MDPSAQDQEMLVTIAFFLVYLGALNAYKVVVDFNTYSVSELQFSATGALRGDGVWIIEENSKGVSNDLWNQAVIGVNKNAEVFSEDNPDSFYDCHAVRSVAPNGALLAAFAYHETGGEPHTMLSWDEITRVYEQCRAGVIILTRAFWPGSEWRTNVEQVLGHPYLYGVAMEFNPDDFGLRSEEDFVNEILAYGKSPFFLLPFRSVTTPTETVMTNMLRGLVQKGAAISDSRVHIVIARYDQPFLPIPGSTNSIESAVAAARNFHILLSQNDTSIYTKPLDLNATLTFPPLYRKRYN